MLICKEETRMLPHSEKRGDEYSPTVLRQIESTRLINSKNKPWETIEEVI